MKFDVKGYGVDNLLKTLHVKKVKIYNLKFLDKNHIEFETDDKNRKKVRRYIANFDKKETLTNFKKLPNLILANLGIIIGVFVGIISFLFMSNFTWQIQVFGTKDLSVSEIISVLENNGIKKGKINLQTSKDIENILLNNYDMIAQVSVIRQGTAIIINLSEKLVYNQTEYAPITATHNGIITNINIITGTTNVKVGDYVNKGDILVLPFNINSNGTKISVMPLAEITATMYILGTCQMDKLETVLMRTGQTCVEYKYKIFNKNLFSGKNKNSFALFETSVYNENISGLVPLTREVIVYHELEQTTIQHDFDKEKQSLIEKSQKLAYQSLLTYDTMLDENTQVKIVGDTMFACTTLTVQGIIHG
ncbi:MAG: sporulation protein YqfD [Clostridia bacterium]|nr:sporulation protein YqfD [Clostridia bacterium]